MIGIHGRGEKSAVETVWAQIVRWVVCGADPLLAVSEHCVSGLHPLYDSSVFRAMLI